MDQLNSRHDRWLTRNLYMVLLGHLFLLNLWMLSRNGVLWNPQTYSDEAEHYRRALLFSRMVGGDISLNTIGTFYAGGIWPPLYSMTIGFVQRLTGADLAALRVFNMAMAYAGFALLAAAITDARLRAASVILAVLFVLGTRNYFQIRPENLTILLIAALIFLIMRKGLFSADEGNARWRRAYGTTGILAALICLTHAVFLLAALYLSVLACLSRRARAMFLIGFLAIGGPYIVAQNLIHNGFVLFATTAEENLARSNNPFLRTHPRSAVDHLFEEMERRYAAGDKVAFPKPPLIPQGRYEQWLHDENQRRIFKAIALDEIRSDPVSALRRMALRFWKLVSGNACLGGRYGCLISPAVDQVFYRLLELAGLLGFVVAAMREWGRWRSFSFVVFCLAILMPMVVIQALVRHFIIVLLLSAFGGLMRLRG
ncbi:MAG: hypothetical protein E5X51_25405 [Mesorhizobium sp.]|uniref:hypothetical protein n=1 Tax=Mesorhizobium sp. TaxID=1871066 RepID=UPI0012002140|nr:hypothetical protein [Mesorhizobium sp.]TIQ18504.1 MAG: hypothetical protein E5X51_25405 [Mesorhizobium sp.]